MYGVFLNVSGVRCMIVGGGRVAERKASALLVSGANLTIISPVLSKSLEAWKAEGKFHHINRPYQRGDVASYSLVFAATDDLAVNTSVYEDCHARGIWVNVADQPDLCSFYVPATICRGDLTLAISTNGANPSLAKAIRLSLEEAFGEEFALFLTMMRQVRNEIKNKIADPDERTEFYRNLLQSDILKDLAHQDLSFAWQTFATKIKEWEAHERTACRNSSKPVGIDTDQLGLSTDPTHTQ
ncbi:bifunctional precorrin-2 dehydrogenase/sirohydrochlorin ferrochelatase [Fodinisporobacter ferrooxydans]|uniref:precorrin-2 dehydrogenase n=1 Tax=Fodinisporobacter ferrooxydans TaxID=2901836 RepID=A0ABY4CLY6_9BACL|nr:bifunctional precorrin-2 dehydrogenase/sirohydrochlorin ferrochelatase [Alicyclobacillaceae bacterium MYW30-H2]